jgi:transcriptional regulator with XRE-family HTH domain
MAKHPRTLSDWMEAAGLTDRDLSERLDISRSQVNRIRRRVSRPTPETARALEQVTRIPAAKFMLGEA